MTAPAPAYQGIHLLADLHGCSGLDNIAWIDSILRAAATAAGATLIDVRLHHFGEGQGVTGVALLAESHISVHSWPEHGYAAIDIFLCGATNDPDAALASIVAMLMPRTVEQRQIRRGYAAQS